MSTALPLCLALHCAAYDNAVAVNEGETGKGRGAHRRDLVDKRVLKQGRAVGLLHAHTVPASQSFGTA